ncbi:hypothetical protein A4R26_05075 [Niastella populi]|uniref:Uncharacterized protein n=1 Tax=Niastella populi TaxID=550983 RepID=A0A1V9FEA3_9BACT|nr:hypothetical protein A4R26_05075 [Niastella populi]
MYLLLRSKTCPGRRFLLPPAARHSPAGTLRRLSCAPFNTALRVFLPPGYFVTAVKPGTKFLAPVTERNV